MRTSDTLQGEANAGNAVDDTLMVDQGKTNYLIIMTKKTISLLFCQYSGCVNLTDKP